MTTPDDTVIYSCLSPVDPITEIQWLLNNTLLEELNLTDVTAGFAYVSGSLTFFNPSDYNVTSVTCRAELQSGEEGSATALLLVQGNSCIIQCKYSEISGCIRIRGACSICRIHKMHVLCCPQFQKLCSATSV